MRRTFFLAALLFAAAAPARAATLPAATEPGITVSRDSGGSYLVTVPASIYRKLAGHRIDIICTSSAARLPAAAPPRLYVTRLTPPSRRGPIRLRPGSGADVCEFSSGTTDGSLPPDFLVALNARARRFLADYVAAVGVADFVTSAASRGRTHASWPTYAELPKDVRTETARLATPGSRVTGKTFGYFSDGRRRMTAAAISATG